MAQSIPSGKSMTGGEFGLSIVLGALSLLSLVVAAKAYTGAYAFHASLFCVASAIAAFAILKRYVERRAAFPPAEIDGRPNYNLGPVKFASVAALFWGIAGFTVGLYIACELAFPWLNFDLAFTNFGRLRPLHTSAVIF